MRCGLEWVPASETERHSRQEAPDTLAEPSPATDQANEGRPAEPAAGHAQGAAPAVADSGQALADPGPSGGPTIASLAAATRAHRRRQLATAWIASLAVLVLALGMGAIWRDDVVAAWPPSERLYDWLHLEASPH
jgi:hypothetical protein